MGVLEGKTALVTGGARGIGASISRLFAAEGAAVVVNDLGGSTDGRGSDASAAEQLAIAPAAATRLVATVDPAKRAIQDRPADDDPSRSPDNIAKLALYIASEHADWLSGRVLGSMGFTVSLYENPTVISEITTAGPWDFDDMVKQMESAVRPKADGLPASLFASQAAR